MRIVETPYNGWNVGKPGMREFADRELYILYQDPNVDDYIVRNDDYETFKSMVGKGLRVLYWRAYRKRWLSLPEALKDKEVYISLEWLQGEED